jgi:hypothetical protein
MSNKIISVSGCKDYQVSMDAYNVLGNRQYSGAMTSCLLLTLEKMSIEKKDWTGQNILPILHMELKHHDFRQIPVICSSHESLFDGVNLFKTAADLR